MARYRLRGKWRHWRSLWSCHGNINWQMWSKASVLYPNCIEPNRLSNYFCRSKSSGNLSNLKKNLQRWRSTEVCRIPSEMSLVKETASQIWTHICPHDQTLFVPSELGRQETTAVLEGKRTMVKLGTCLLKCVCYISARSPWESFLLQYHVWKKRTRVAHFKNHVNTGVELENVCFEK